MDLRSGFDFRHRILFLEKEAEVVILSGILLYLATRLPPLWPLIYIAFIPWLRSVTHTTATPQKIVLSTLCIGWFSTYIFFGWAAPQLATRFDLSPVLGIFSFILIGVVAHLQFATTALALRFLRKKVSPTMITVFLFPFLYTFFEALLPDFLGEKMGYWVYPSPSVSQLAALGGVSILTFWVMFNNGVIYHLVELFLKKSRSAALFCFGALILIHGLIFWRGSVVTESWNRVWKEAPPGMKMTLIPGIPLPLEQARAKEPKELIIESLGYLLFWTDQALKSGFKPDLLLWPESGIPFRVDEVTPKSLPSVYQQQKKWKTPLLTGGFNKDKGKLYNSVFLIDDMKSTQEYHKMYLVPLAEKLFSAGAEPVIFDATLKIGALICYDGQFESLAKAYSKMGADVLAVFSDNSSMHGTSIPYFQFQFLKFRAIETRIPVVHATTFGVSGLISPSGEILQSSHYGRRGDFLNIEIKKVRK